MKSNLMVSFASDIYALKALAAHRNGNVVCSAWRKLGYISFAELAAAKCQGDEAALTEAMVDVRGSMTTLLNLDVLPD